MKFLVLGLIVAVVTSVGLAKPSGQILNKAAAYKQLMKATVPNPKATEKQGSSAKGITAAFVIQNSKDLTSTLLKMSNIAPNVVSQLNDNKDWISNYAFYQFDNKSVSQVTVTSLADNLVTEINGLVDETREKQMICKGLNVYDALIAALSDKSATKGIQVFLYVYGGLVVDQAKSTQLKQLIDNLGAKIHVTQSEPSISCFDQDFSDVHVQAIADIAQYSGGLYSLSGEGLTLLTLPRQYDSKTIRTDSSSACQGTRSISFTVDSKTWSISTQLYGDIEGDPTLTDSNGKNYELDVIYKSVPDRAYGASANKGSKFPAGQYTLTYNLYSSSNPQPCGVRVDAQTDA